MSVGDMKASQTEERTVFQLGEGVKDKFQAEATFTLSLKGRWDGPLVFMPKPSVFGLGSRDLTRLEVID